MKRNVTRIVVMLLAAALCLPSLSACNKTKQKKFDAEIRPLVMSIQTPDGVFNPFFATSAYDTEIVGMTQISMLSADKAGNVAYGDNEPVVVKDMQVNTTGTGANTQTTYEFILKKGIRFSDGTELTMKDVLFNLYTYLDPAYTGSLTIYSTKIIGLLKYRTQNPNATEGSAESFEQNFISKANERITDLINYTKDYGYASASERPNLEYTAEQVKNINADFVAAKATFLQELNDDWNAASNNKETYKDWGFTEGWQIFMLNDGQMTELLATDATGKYIVDDDGNYKINTEESDALAAQIEEYLEENDYTDETRAEGIKTYCVESVLDVYFGTKPENTNAAMLEMALTYWVTAQAFRDKLAAQIKGEYFADSVRAVPTIEGIDGSTTRTTDFSGKALGSAHEVLKITIQDIDPKAIWNFAFTVAPMHYYSSRNYKGKDYISAFNPNTGEFGIEFSSPDFMDEVIKHPDKLGLPMGAGVYKASTARGGTDGVTSDKFNDKNMIYFERNEHFHTLGGSITNAKIKYLRYKVVESDQIINALAGANIDFGSPGATQDNIKALDSAKIVHKETYTSGYGYVGINPRFVPNINVRRAIMKAMNTDIIVQNYYKGGLADIIYRPMSTTSWAYPKGATVYKNQALNLDYSYDGLGDEIEKMVQDEGYTRNSRGIYTKTIPGFGEDILEYDFTIAGRSTDHPAYAMFLDAAQRLNRRGFKIKVVTSQTALSDLTTGKLAVWAAAWSSAIDPDMYQIYHKDSMATSVNNWGYKQIKANKTLYAVEWNIITDLSKLIDDGRAVNSRTDRAEIYHEALDKIMQLAVEMPTYQRKDLSAYNADVLDPATMTPDSERTPYNGLLSRVWELNYR